MEKFVGRPDIALYPGVIVDKDTKLEYKAEGIKQTVKGLVLRSIVTVRGEGYKSTNDTTIYLEEGDILLFEEGGRGYIKPVGGFCTVEEAIADLEALKGGEQ